MSREETGTHRRNDAGSVTAASVGFEKRSRRGHGADNDSDKTFNHSRIAGVNRDNRRILLELTRK